MKEKTCGTCKYWNTFGTPDGYGVCDNVPTIYDDYRTCVTDEMQKDGDRAAISVSVLDDSGLYGELITTEKWHCPLWTERASTVDN